MLKRSYLISVIVILNIMLTSISVIAQDVNDSQRALTSDLVFMPVRDAVETLGGKLNWDESTGSLTVINDSGSGTIRIGQRIATIRGVPVNLPSAPYIIDGQAYAPIIFFNDMYDMALVWNKYFHRFEWKPIVPPRPGRLSRPPVIIYGPARQTNQKQVTTTGTIVGEVLRVDPTGDPGSIAVKIGNKTRRYSLERDTIIIRGRIGGNAAEIPITDIRPGDRAVIRFNPNGLVSSVRAQYLLTRGKVSAVASNTILLDSGETIKVLPKTSFVVPGNMTGTIQNINPGDTIAASISPISRMAYIIRVFPSASSAAVSPEGQTETGDSQVTLNSYGPFKSGDTITVKFKGTPGGKAFFSIPGVASNIKMNETDKGTYQGKYTVGPGDNAAGEMITVNFESADGRVDTRTSNYPITVKTIAGYLPQITSPRQGAEVSSPLVVTGMATPGATVRVSIEYRTDNQEILPIEGLSAYQEVKAGGDGRWKTEPLPVNSPFSEDETRIPSDLGVFSGIFDQKDQPPIIYTITADIIAPDGAEQSSTRIQVTKFPGITVGG